MKRKLWPLLLATGLCLAASTGSPPPAASRAGDLKAFAAAALVPGSIDVVAIPRRYNMLLVEEDVAYDGWKSHLPKEGRYELTRHRGADHYLPWDYDARVPLVFDGPSRVVRGSSRKRTSLRDVVPTLCRLLDMPASLGGGSILTEALVKSASGPPRLILMFVIDQGGWFYLNEHPRDYPFLAELMARGFVFSETRVDHGPAATAVSHAVLGTGGYPREHGVNDNKPFMPALNQALEIYGGPQGLDTTQLRLPTVADIWDLWTANQAKVFVYSSASRAAVGLAGHGADFRGGDRDMVFWYDLGTRRFVTSERQFRMPEGIQDREVKDYRSLNHFDPLWSNQEGLFKDGRSYDKLWIGSPGFARFEGDALEAALSAEDKIGGDPVTDLVFINLKATDYAGHYLGAESLEAGRALAEVDRTMRRLFEMLKDRTEGDMVTIVTADHGVAPLTELSGGSRLWKDDLAREIEARFGGGGRRVVKHVYRAGLCLDLTVLNGGGHTLADVKDFLLGYRVDGKPFFEAVFTRDELD